MKSAVCNPNCADDIATLPGTISFMNCYIQLNAYVHGRTEWNCLQKSAHIIVVVSLRLINCFSVALGRFPPFFASCSADPFRGRAGVQPTLGLSGMNGIRRTFSFRKKKKKSESTDGSKPQQWLDDEAKIKEGSCSFQVKYLGNIEVYESRGMQVCEEAIKALRKSKVGFHRLLLHNHTCFLQKKPQKAILYVSGDALRVSDDVSQHLIVDQTIEKVSFCAPDRSHDKGFAYICRDGATRRWMCHAFLALKDSGERLSHAVGCAFAICLEKKQKRERDALQLATSDDRSFTRIGSFRPASLAERLIDPQSAILIEPVASTGDNKSHSNASPPSTTAPSITGNAIVASPAIGALRSSSPSGVAGAIPRPRPSPSILERQGSLRLFPKLQATSPFKRDLSLRLEQLPSNLQRLTRVTNGDVIPEESGPDFEEPFIGSSPVSSTSRSMKALGQPTSTTSVPTFPTTNANYFISQRQPVPLTGPVVTATSPISAHSITQLQTPSPDQSFPDPFSAAPFNPATIQQHQQTQQDNSWSNLEALSHLSISTNMNCTESTSFYATFDSGQIGSTLRSIRLSRYCCADHIFDTTGP
ncbi:protein numb [Clonorchis sinensis]|uniref:Protein numb n=1 Tax=Clonorchis sinensis TaxID=79923 RepID=H2KRF8_CLOSI|nr:protein numb [Clonorchis sinensis]